MAPEAPRSPRQEFLTKSGLALFCKSASIINSIAKHPAANHPCGAGSTPSAMASSRAMRRQSAPPAGRIAQARSQVVRDDHKRNRSALGVDAAQRANTSANEAVSRLPVSSSASTSGGFMTSARAMATRCCMPPDSSAGRLFVHAWARPRRRAGCAHGRGGRC